MVILILHLEDEAQEAKVLPVRSLAVLKCMVQVGVKAKGQMQLILTLNSFRSQWSCIHPVFHLINNHIMNCIYC